MADESYRKLINESKRKLSELKARRDELDVEMGKLRLLIFATANMLPDNERDEAMEGVSEETLAQRVGLTEAIRGALGSGGSWQSPKQIRDSLETSGYDVSEYGNVMASIHTVLKRLVTAGQAERKDAENGGYVYRGKVSGAARLAYTKGAVSLSRAIILANREAEQSKKNAPNLDAVGISTMPEFLRPKGKK
jgi:hypothetical protein